MLFLFALVLLLAGGAAAVRAQAVLDSFDPNAEDDVWAFIVQPDGTIIIGGDFIALSPNGGAPVERHFLAKLNQDGTVDPAFDPGPNGSVRSLAVQADGKILAGGGFNTIGGQGRIRLARLDPTTGVVDSFNPAPNSTIWPIAVQADGKILVGGFFTSVGGKPRNRIARLDPVTGLADSFDPSSNGSVRSIAVQADGKILVGGFFDNIGGQTRIGIARLDPTTGLADSFDPSMNGGVLSFALPADGKILVGGNFIWTGGQTRFSIARLDATTGLADSFDPSANDNVWSIVPQDDGKILVGGEFNGANSIGGQARNRIARLDPATGLADSFAADVSDDIWSVAVQPDGKILAGGSFVTIGGQSRNRIARFLAPTPGPTPAATATVTPQATPTPTPNPTPTPSPSATPAPGPSATPTPTGTPAPPAQALNLSTRMQVQTGDNVGIAGFIITGTAPKHVLLRVLGPSMAHGFRDVLDDPVLELHGPDGFVTITNDNWRDTQEDEIKATGLPPGHDVESAIDATLAPGAYTAVARGTNQSTGSALIEIYDLTPAAPAKLANISTRAFVGTQEDIVIAGLILGANSGDDRIVVRGLGPSLTALGVSNALANPRLELRDDNAELISNNNWQDDPAQAAEINAAGLALSTNLEAGIAATLPPGRYTVLLLGENNGTGVGLIEVYDRGAP